LPRQPVVQSFADLGSERITQAIKQIGRWYRYNITDANDHAHLKSANHTIIVQPPPSSSLVCTVTCGLLESAHLKAVASSMKSNEYFRNISREWLHCACALRANINPHLPYAPGPAVLWLPFLRRLFVGGWCIRVSFRLALVACALGWLVVKLQLAQQCEYKVALQSLSCDRPWRLSCDVPRATGMASFHPPPSSATTYTCRTIPCRCGHRPFGPSTLNLISLNITQPYPQSFATACRS
jgi:hypothetical protein